MSVRHPTAQRFVGNCEGGIESQDPRKLVDVASVRRQTYRRLFPRKSSAAPQLSPLLSPHISAVGPPCTPRLRAGLKWITRGGRRHPPLLGRLSYRRSHPGFASHRSLIFVSRPDWMETLLSLVICLCEWDLTARIPKYSVRTIPTAPKIRPQMVVSVTPPTPPPPSAGPDTRRCGLRSPGGSCGSGPARARPPPRRAHRSCGLRSAL